MFGATVRHLAERARDTRLEADTVACQAWNARMLAFQGPAQPSPALAKEVPEAEHQMKQVQAAAHCVIAAAENESAGWMTFARMGMMQAINRHAATADFSSKRKQRPPAKLIKRPR